MTTGKNDARKDFRNILAIIYDSIPKMKTVLTDAGIDTSRIPTEGAVRDIWTTVLLEVENQGEARIDKLVRLVLADYEGEDLSRVAEHYVSTFLGQLPPDTRKILDQWTAAVKVTLPEKLDRRLFYYWATDGHVKSYKTAVDAEFRVRSLAEIDSPRNLALLILPRRNPTSGDGSGTRGVRKILFKWHSDWLDVLPSIDSTKIDVSKWPQHTSGPWSVDQWLSLVNSRHYREGLVRYGIGYHSPRHVGGLVTFKRSPKRQENGFYHYVLFTAEANIDADRLNDEDGKAYECLSKASIEERGALVEERDPTNAVIRSFRRRDRFEDPNGDVFRTLERLGWFDANSFDELGISETKTHTQRGAVIPYVDSFGADDRVKLFRFLALFSRWECALKHSEFALVGKAGEAKADWNGFAAQYQAEIAATTDSAYLDARAYLLNNPPLREELQNKTIKWEKNPRRPKETDESYLLRVVRDVRNNLFHGGKFPGHPMSDLGRDRRLIDSATVVLEVLIGVDERIKNRFNEAPEDK